MKISDGKLQTRHFFLFNGNRFSYILIGLTIPIDSLLYAKPAMLKKTEGLWVFCGQWALDRIQIIDISPFSDLPARYSPSATVVLRGSGGSEGIRGSGGSSPYLGPDRIRINEVFKANDDTLSSPSWSPSSTPASTPSSTPLSSPQISPNPSPSPTTSPTLEPPRRGLTGTGAQKLAAQIPLINLNPPTPANSRRHSQTDAEPRKEGSLRSVALHNIKDKRENEEDAPTFSPRGEHKRSLSESASDELIANRIHEDSKLLSDTDNKHVTSSSINLVRSQSAEHQKLLASLPENGIILPSPSFIIILV